jgi:hypothetical protein
MKLLNGVEIDGKDYDCSLVFSNNTVVSFICKLNTDSPCVYVQAIDNLSIPSFDCCAHICNT